MPVKVEAGPNASSATLDARCQASSKDSRLPLERQLPEFLKISAGGPTRGLDHELGVRVADVEPWNRHPDSVRSHWQALLCGLGGSCGDPLLACAR